MFHDDVDDDISTKFEHEWSDEEQDADLFQDDQEDEQELWMRELLLRFQSDLLPKNGFNITADKNNLLQGGKRYYNQQPAHMPTVNLVTLKLVMRISDCFLLLILKLLTLRLA